jgi:hypothetical protein
MGLTIILLHVLDRSLTFPVPILPHVFLAGILIGSEVLCHGNRYHIWSGDHTRTFYVPHRSGGGATRPGNSSRVYLGQNLSDSRMITHLFRNILHLLAVHALRDIIGLPLYEINNQHGACRKKTSA